MPSAIAPRATSRCIVGRRSRLAVVVRAVAARQEAETWDRRKRTGHRIGEAVLEPADRAGAGAAEDDAFFPCRAQVPIEFPFAPDGEHTARVAAADEYRVLLEHERAEVARRAGKERQMRRPAVELAEPRVESQATRVGVAVRRADERNPGLALAGLPEEILDEQEVIQFKRQGRAADSNYLFFH